MRITVLGPVEVERDGEFVSVGGPQQRRLLAFLVVHRGHTVSTDRLVDALWPDGVAPEGAARSMRTYLSRLRAVLPDTAVISQGSGYMLDLDGLELDVEEFDSLIESAERMLPDQQVERYDDALALWRDVPFGEFSDEWWALAESSRLIERRNAAQENRAAALIAMGHHGRAIPGLEAMVAAQPLRERPVRLLMVALEATGRRAEALRVYRSFRTRLGEETGLEPSRELVELQSRIVADDGLGGLADERPLRGYTILRSIGEGAYGRVYAATQPGTDREVAIKAIRPDLADSSEFVRRFEVEARLVARLEHPHIVPLYDFWREPGGAFLVFRLLGGGTARDSVIAGGPWSLARVSTLVEEVSGALMSAHAAGVIHNDVKASNVLLDDDGAAYLTDFGIAIVRGESYLDDGGERRDVRDLAWLVWELLAGARPPSETWSSSSVQRWVPGTTPSLVGRVEPVPDGLDAVLTRATSVADGYASVAEFLLAWRAATAGVDGQLGPITSSGRRAVDSERRHAARALALTAAAGINPYRGLRPFDEADVASFHGRTAVVNELVEHLSTSRFVAVVGASGSGKSSVVRAGLLPRLRAHDVVVVTMIPGDDPVGALRAALTEVATVSDLEGSDVTVDTIDDVARHFGRVVVVIDQFEECWTRSSADDREAFVDVVARAVDDTAIDVRFVATVRADLLDRPLEHPRLGKLVAASAHVLTPLSPAELDEAIVLPAACAQVRYDDGVLAELIADAVTHPGSLPLLQFTLTELYDRRVDGIIGRAALDAVGGMTGAVGRRAEEVFLDLADDQQASARGLFARLVVPGEGQPDARRRARLSELSPGMRSVADRFVEARLLVSDRDPATREPTIEVAHEALLERWSRLTGWIHDDERWLVHVQHLSGAARTWDATGRHDAELYRGARLEASIEATEVDGREISGLEHEFVEAGRQARDAEIVAARRTARRLRRRLTAVAIALVVALVAGAVALVQRGDALDASRTAEIEALVGRAEALRGSQRDAAALLAVEAHRLADTPRTRSALFGTFTDEERFLDAHRFEGDRGTSGMVLPDGESAFLTDQAGRLHVYALDTGALGPALPPVGDGDPFPVLASSPDGGQIALAARSDPRTGPTSVGVFDAHDFTLAFEPVVVDGPVTSIAFLPGARIALAIGEEGRLVVLDAATGVETGSVPGMAIPEDNVIWTMDPDGVAGGRRLRRASAVAIAGDELLLGAADGSVRVLDADSLEERRTLALGAQTVSNLWPLDDGTMVTSGRYGVARVDLATGETSWIDDEFERCVNLTVDEPRGSLFCGDPYGRLEERRLIDGAVTRRLDAQNGNSGSLWIASDATELVSFGNNEPVVSRWRLDRSGPITHLAAPGWEPLAFNSTGELLVLERGDPFDGTYEGSVIDVRDGSTLDTFDDVFVIGWSEPDVLFGITRDADGNPVLAHVDLVDGRRVGPPVSDGVPAERTTEINDIRLDTGKDRVLLRYNDNSLAGLDTDSQGYGATVPTDGLVEWTIDRAGDRILAGTTSGVVVYDGTSGDEIGRLPDANLRGAFVSPTDQLFVSSLGGELTQYDLVTLEPIRSFGGSRGLVFDLTGTGDGSTIAINGGDRTVAVFDVASGVQLGGPITIAADEKNLSRLSLDGGWLAVAGQPDENDGLLPAAIEAVAQPTQIWSLQPDTWEQAACALAGRNLTRAEWDTHIGDLAPYRATCPDFPSDD